MATVRRVHPVIMSSDVCKTLEFLRKLGFETIFSDDSDQPTYAGVCRDDVELHVQWNNLSSLPEDVDRPTLRFLVDDVDALAEDLAAGGLDLTPFRSSWGTYEFHIQDHDRNGYQFYQVLQ